MRKKRIVNRIGRVISYSSLGILALLLLAILLPTVKDTTSAADCTPGEEPCTTTRAEAGIDLTVASTVSVALQNLINLEVTPKTSGAFTESTAKLTVATNNPSGYAVYMQAGSTTNGKASLVSSDLSNTAMISPISGTVESSSFSANTWGYSLDGTHYQAVPATTGIIKETSSTTFSDTYDLSFGVNVDTNLPAGQYTNSVIVSAVANPIKVTSLSQLNYMQDMTTDICTNTAEHVTKQLIDTRDGKSYWIAKLKGGNCWMTQNLAFTITQEMIDNGSINSSNTDIGYDENGTLRAIGVNGKTPENGKFVWDKNGNNNICDENTANSCTAPKVTATSLDGTTPAARSATSSFNLGKWVLATPIRHLDCGTAQSMEICQNVGIVNVNDSEWSNTFSAQNGTWRDLGTDNTYSGLIAADITTKTYDSHYLIGNYYRYPTITANSGTLLSDKQNAVDSICPKGWKLPTAGPDTQKVNGSYAFLAAQYGIYGALSGNSSTNGLGIDGTYNLLANPLYFFRAGIVFRLSQEDIIMNTVNSVGQQGSYLSATTWTYTSNMYTMGIENTATFSGYPSRDSSLQARCLVR